jgi:hypothetical protein
MHIETITAKGFRTFNRVYPLSKNERLNTNIKLIVHKVLITSLMTYGCPAWEFAANTYLLKLRTLQNKVLRTLGNFPRRTPTHELRTAFNIPHVYDFIT